MKTNRLVLLLLLLSSAPMFQLEALPLQIFGLYSGFVLLHAAARSIVSGLR